MIQNAKVVGAQIDPEVYHRRDENVPRGHSEYIMSRGELIEFAHCPHRWVNGYHEEESSKPMQWGSLIDTLLLDPDRFSAKYAIAPPTYMAEGKKKNDPPTEKKWNLNATYCSNWVDAQKGKTVIKVDEYAEALKAVEVIKSDGSISNIIDHSSKQVFVVAEYLDEETGIIVPLRILIDIVPEDKSLIDLKTCISAEPRAWSRAVYQHGYHVQAAFYLDVYNAAMGDSRNEFRHIIQESFPPYEIGKRVLSDEFIALGRNKYQEALKLYAKCLRDYSWPSYEELQNYSINGWGIVDTEAYMI